MPALNFKPKNVTKQLVSVLKERTKDIIIQRFGLGDGKERRTLEAIGDNYGITRERIRQITNFAFDVIKESNFFEANKDVFDELKSAISEKGKILAEKDLLGMLANDKTTENHIHFLLVLGNDFIKLKEDDEFHHRWTISAEHAEKVHEAIRYVHKEISENDIFLEKNIIVLLKKHGEKILETEINDDVARIWLNLSKVVGSNALGEWGLTTSPNIKPRGVRDLAFLVLRKEGSPMHFIEVTKKISANFDKEGNPATVHNELIKDNRFVLVGRGLYALSEWGYQNGTVRDVIRIILKSNGPVSKEEIVKKVLKERYVKENTILVNLQNRSFFKRNKEGKYLIV